MNRFGYCCLNLSTNLRVNRSCTFKSFKEKGLDYVGDLALKNVQDLVELIKWNNSNLIYVYRMSSDMIPWNSMYDIEELPQYNLIKEALECAGGLAVEFNQRLSFHPGPFCVLGSPNETFVTKTLTEIENHSKLMDIMKLSATHYYPINIHCNGHYGDKIKTMQRWALNFKRLSPNAQARLVVENDDKLNLYSIKDLLYLHGLTGCPITLDIFHHTIHPDTLSLDSAANAVKPTWGSIKPLFHYSNSKTLEDKTLKFLAHSDWIYEKCPTFNFNFDCELETKMKDLSLLKYRRQYELNEN